LSDNGPVKCSRSRIVDDKLDATVKMTGDYPALTSTFEIVIGGRPQCAQAKLGQRSPDVIMGGLPAGTAGGDCDSEVLRASLLEH